METKIITPHPEKLVFLNKDLTTKINESTEDLLKMTNQWSWWHSISSKSVFKVLHQSRALLFGKYCFLREEYEKSALLYQSYTKKLMRLTSIDGDDKMLEIEVQKEEIEARTELHRSFVERQEDYIAGNEAKSKMLASDSVVNFNEAEYVKSNDYLDAVKNSNAQAKSYPSKPEVAFEKAMDLPFEQAEKNNAVQEATIVNQTTQSVQESKPKQVIQTQEGSAPDYYVAEEQLQECMESAGENYVCKFSNPTTQSAKSVTLSTTSKEVLKQPSYKQNILAHVSLDKVIWAVVVYCIVILGEIFIFSTIYETSFNFSKLKSIITGSAPLLISFVLGFGQYGTILNYIRSNNQIALRLVRSSRFMLGAIILGLCYAMCMGFLYMKSLEKDDLRKQISMLTQEQYAYSDDSESMSPKEKQQAIQENTTKINKATAKLEALQGDTMATIVVSVSSLIFLLFSGIMFGILLLFLSAYKTQRAMKKIENRLPRIEAEFYSQENVITEVDTLSNRILNWMGQKRFLEKLLAGESTRDILFAEPNKNAVPSFSTNGIHHNEHITNL
jgi:chemotaxis protein histidine kinase CheA